MKNKSALSPSAKDLLSIIRKGEQANPGDSLLVLVSDKTKPKRVPLSFAALTYIAFVSENLLGKKERALREALSHHLGFEITMEQLRSAARVAPHTELTDAVKAKNTTIRIHSTGDIELEIAGRRFVLHVSAVDWTEYRF